MSSDEKDYTAQDPAEVMEKPDYEKEILGIIRGKASPKAMLAQLEDYHANDLAQAIESLDIWERKKLYRICTVEMLAEVFEHLDEPGTYFNEMDIQKAAAVVAELETDTAANILHETEKEKRAAIIEMLPHEIRQEIHLMATFDDDEIGSRMTTNCIIIRENLTIKQAMSELIAQAKENDNITTLFVVDETGEFYGAIDLKDLITADAGDSLENLIQTSFPY
ncbi:MAG: magnesium transporter, partial [Oscillospiraceae bacterium]|nr:magnesium transporter [Oscillospiraceae bacterium]